MCPKPLRQIVDAVRGRTAALRTPTPVESRRRAGSTDATGKAKRRRKSEDRLVPHRLRLFHEAAASPSERRDFKSAASPRAPYFHEPRPKRRARPVAQRASRG